MEKHLHIIALTVPFPVDYGGVFDLFYKLPALQQEGVHIHLHCFDDGRGEQKELNQYCASVNYYQRTKGHKGFTTSLPYIVSSRKNETLFDTLLKDDHPILMEGIHCTYLLNDERFLKRKKYVRLHNVEQEYYRHLFRSANAFIPKLYYWWESNQLKKYEKSIAAKATAFWAVTQKDTLFFRIELGYNNIDYLPVYLPSEWKIKYPEGKGNYCLYHGDLSVAANEKAVIWLLEEVFNKLQLPFVIAGKNPSKKLERAAYAQKHTCLVANPNEKEMQDMISKAHINILPSFTNTGIKLKLLNALFNGRFVAANNATVEGSELDQFCVIANDANSFQKKINALFSEPFLNEITEQRRDVLNKMFSNEANAKQQVKWIWGE